MFGLGFLFTAALGGVALVCWPIYLHFRKRNRRVQVVPSLRLFGFVRKKTRLLRLQQLLLLIARAAILIALFLLLAQPFIRTTLQLPFPRVAGEVQEERILAVVLDDSISSLHENAGGTRMAQAKAAVAACIRSLPSKTKVVFVPVSCPFPTEPLPPKQALAFLETVETVPMQGNAVDALRNLAEVLSGQPCCIVVATPRKTKLWNNLKLGIFKEKTPVIFFDTSTIESQALVVGYGDNVVRLAGQPEAMQQLKIQVAGEKGEVTFHKVTTHDALRGELALELDGDKSRYHKISFVRDSPNPWNSWYAQAGRSGPTDPTVAIIREPSPAAILVDQMVTAILLSFNEKVSLHHLDPAGPKTLPEADVLVIAGNPRISQALRPWINQRLAAGVRVVCIPIQGMAAGVQELPFLPTWHARIAIHPADLPLSSSLKSTLPLDDLSLLGLSQLPVTETFQPSLGEEQQIVLSTRNGRTVLVTRKLSKGSSVWALGFPLAADPASPAWHPAFPILMQQIMLPGGQAQRGAVATVGKTVRLHEWFGRDEVSGELKSPDGSTRHVASTNAGPLTIALDAAGPYTLTLDSGETLWRVANYPRDTSALTFPREKLDEQGELIIRWVDDSIQVGAADFRKLGEPADIATVQVLDLSVLALALLAAALLLEAVMLWLVWRREGFVRA